METLLTPEVIAAISAAAGTVAAFIVRALWRWLAAYVSGTPSKLDDKIYQAVNDALDRHDGNLTFGWRYWLRKRRLAPGAEQPAILTWWQRNREKLKANPKLWKEMDDEAYYSADRVPGDDRVRGHPGKDQRDREGADRA